MAQYNLGRCFPVVKGNWINSESYLALDIVFYRENGCSYICKNDTTPGTAPTNTAFWTKISERGEKGDSGSGGGSGVTVEQVNSLIDDRNYTTMAAVESKGYQTSSDVDAKIRTATSIYTPIVNYIDEVDINLIKVEANTIYVANNPVDSLNIEDAGVPEDYESRPSEIYFTTSGSWIKLQINPSIGVINNTDSMELLPDSRYMIVVKHGIIEIKKIEGGL